MDEHGAPRTSGEGAGDWGDSRKRPMLEDIVASGFSTPWDAPLIPPFPFTFRNAEVLTLAYRTESAAIEALLPPPLEPTGDAVMIHVYRMRDVEWIGAYGECNVMVGARLPETGEEGAYSPYLFLDTDVGVAHGREVHGQPKKWAEPKLEARDDLFVGTVTRNGIDVITGTLPYKQRRDTLASVSSLMDFSTNINLKAVDHIDGRPAIRQLTSRRLGDLTVHECWGGPCTVELRPNAQAPVHKLPVKEMLGGLYWRADFTLVPGRVLYDYLEPPAKGTKQSSDNSASVAAGGGTGYPKKNRLQHGPKGGANWMVGRIWRGWTKPENADKYEALLKAEIFPEIAGKDVPGYRGIQLLREPADEGKSEVEFVTIMWFDSWESVRRFAGDDYERAYVPPRAREVLERFDERSRHYEVRERLEY